MGNRRPRPQRIHEKLRQIRETMGISQPRMPERLGLPGMHPGRISEYETNKREPSLHTLLAYADLAGVHLEFIVNDNLELPERLPGSVHYGIVPPDVSE